ncbi:MAG: hypothetical protein J6P03_00800 [Opitutales bacterium]|nr:hypothetical protein [Opitutales bacterium]
MPHRDCGLRVVPSQPDRENSAEFSGYKHIFKIGGENSIGAENFDKILYSFESARAFNGDGETFLKIRLKPEALNRVLKNPSKNPASTWIPGTSLNAYQKKAAEFAFNCYEKRLSPEFSERHLFYFRRIRSGQWSDIYFAEVLIYDTKEHILYYADTKI